MSGSITDKQLLKVAFNLKELSSNLDAISVGAIFDGLNSGLEKAASVADNLARNGEITFAELDRIFLAICDGNHVKSAQLQADLARNRVSCLEKKASIEQKDAFTEFITS